jgi:beta-lactam-binding protein with PASTA domain
VVAVFFLASCNVQSSLGGSSSSSSTTPSSSTSTASSSASGGASHSGTERAAMIDLTGKTADEAKAALRTAGFSGELEINRIALECVDAKEVPGQINCQNPMPGQLHYRHAAVNVHVYEAPTHTGRLIRSQLEKVVGMTVANATKYMKTIGHTGELLVYEDPHTFHKNCAKDSVCDYAPSSGTGTGDRVTLIINKKSVDITLPD